MAQRLDRALLALHAGQPFAQGEGIVLPEAEGAHEFQARLLGFLAEARQRGQHAAGKDIMADEIAAGAIAGKQLIADGDGLDDGAAAALQPLGQAGEIGRPVMLAHRLEHLDRDDIVEQPF